jgi:PAS domain S-box-containing protein
MNEPNTASNQRVLVIDDNPSIHEDFRKILGARKTKPALMSEAEAVLFGGHAEPFNLPAFEIDSALQGKEGLEKVQRALEDGRPYAMAFVDVRMPPGWDGIETISRIWQACPELQVVICTAYSDYSWDEMIKRLGRTDNMVILKKPFDNVEVLQLAHAFTRKWVLAQQSRWQLKDLDRMVNGRTEELRAANEKLLQEAAERQQSQEALRLSEERFAKAFRASPIPMAINQLEQQRYIDVNESFEKMTGYAREELLGRTASELEICVDPQRRAEMFKEIEEHKSVRNIQSKLRTKSGKMRDTLVSAEMFSSGTQNFALVVSQDITERLSLEIQLRQAQKMEAVGQLASGIAHDFNNILTVIQGHVGLMLASENLQREAEESLREVANGAERAASLTRQLLVFSHKQVVQLKVLDLNEVIRNLEKMMRRLIGEQVNLQCHYAEPLPRICADACNLEQVIMNLAVNARDAMPKGGSLTITTAPAEIDAAYMAKNPQARTGTYVRLTITDTGCGMDPQVMSRMFEPFFTTKEVGKGTGLGLSTVYGIVKQHGGWIEVTSEIGRGTSFVIYLPFTDKIAKADGAKPVARKVDGGKETVLLVEDEIPLRELACKVLKGRGYNVLEAGTGVEALDVWRRQEGRVDLLLTDMVMPDGLSGRDLARKLQAMKSDLPIIYSSGYSLELVGGDFTQKEEFNFLSKPYNPLDLIQAVRNCLDVHMGGLKAEPAG